MLPYHIEESAVSPATALRMMGRTSAATVFGTILQLAEGIVEMIPYDEKLMGSRRVQFAKIATAIWIAGRAQGVHEERERRRKKARESQEVIA